MRENIVNKILGAENSDGNAVNKIILMYVDGKLRW